MCRGVEEGVLSTTGVKKKSQRGLLVRVVLIDFFSVCNNVVVVGVD